MAEAAALGGVAMRFVVSIIYDVSKAVCSAVAKMIANTYKKRKSNGEIHTSDTGADDA